jgi:alpha-glucosidase (family GH31 glycosyl hydrolase)
MAGNQANAMRCGFMGFPVWGADTGGYLGEGRINETLYARWLQWGTWNGMFEIKIDGSGGSGEDRPPWKYSQQLQDIFRHACEQRMALLPTIYSCVNTSHENGVVMKPLAYAYPKDKSTYEIWDEYIFGHAFLVAPVFTETNTRTIYLPIGTWIDYDDHNKTYQGPTTFTRDVPLDRIPVFIKQNAVYVTGNIYSGSAKIWDPTPENGRSITIHVFPGQVNDQTTFQYMDYLDNDITKTLQLKRSTDKIELVSEALSTPSTIRIKCQTRPERLVLNQHPVSYEYDDQNRTVVVQVAGDQPMKLAVYNQ